VCRCYAASMLVVKSQEFDTSEAGYSTMDETEPTRDLCPANIAPPGQRYRSCGKKMRRYRNGVTVCEDHGEMH
jgi:hypothetical protein